MDRNRSVIIGICGAVISLIVVFTILINLPDKPRESELDKAIKERITPTVIPESRSENEKVLQTLNGNTKYFLQTYYVNANDHENLSETEYIIPSRFVTYTRDELQDYIDGYMENMPLSEYLDGLIDYEIIDFSKNKLVLRKTYASDWNKENEYYLCDEDGEVVVYYNDKKTVYEYTGMKTNDLSDEDRIKIKIGYYVSDEEELYSLLESFSS
ncbi:MAG: hypothetical protein E7267_04145 [Lachnospiraceae bacterium]|nr:hypothetical protein [Lachnospiraceae bacterium]